MLSLDFTNLGFTVPLIFVGFAVVIYGQEKISNMSWYQLFQYIYSNRGYIPWVLFAAAVGATALLFPNKIVNVKT